MTVYRLGRRLAFPPPEDAEPSGLLAVGGDLAAERLLLAYAMGIFPWYTDDTPILWFSPDPRGVLLPSSLVVHRSLARRVRSGRYRITFDRAFREVIRGCAAAQRPGQDGTWITYDMIDAYEDLHGLGLAHSVEAWERERLVGGLYGVSMGGAFFGESMFARAVDASKVAFVHLVQQLRRWRFDLIDCQVRNAHMTTLGARDWPRDRFLEVLAHSLQKRTRRGVWHFDEGFDPLETAAPGEAVESVETADSPEAVGLPQAADSRETVDSRRPAGSRESADPPEAVPPRRRAEPPETA